MSTTTAAAEPTFGEANFAEAELGDIRRTRRLVSLADALRRHPSGSLPNKIPRPRELKALYRICGRREVTHRAVLAPHRMRTQRLCVEHETILILHDSTELDYSKRKSLSDLGDIGGPGRHRGYICHNSLAVLPEDGTVLGLVNQVLHKRVKPPKKETKTQLRNRKSRMSRLWLEGVADLPADRRLVDVCDRGADTFEFLEHELNSGRRFVVRSSHSRRIVSTSSSIAKLFLHAHLRGQRAWGKYELKVRAHDGMPARKARLSVSAAEARLIPPRAKKGHHGNEPLTVGVVRVWESNPPKGQKPLEWFLLTNEPLISFTSVRRVVRWYERRWVIEEFHKGMKTGCQVEGLQFKAEERLQPAIALLSIVALTLLQLRDASRQPDADTKSASHLFSRAYIDVLCGWRYDQIGQDISVTTFFLALGRLGGHQNRKRDGRPGWLTLWRGWTKLQIMVEGVHAFTRKKCG
jgi:transposase-like protein